MKQISAFKFLPIGILSVSSFLQAGVSMDPEGWTRIAPSSDSRIVYVSSSEGSDTNDGLTPQTPKATILVANNLIRNGYPDHLLLKRGDTFELTGAGLHRWKNGRSADEPVVISYYGDSGPRPVIKIENSFINHDGLAMNYQAFIGMDIYKANSDPESHEFTNASCSEGIRFVGGGTDILVEDCRLRYTMMNVLTLGGIPYREVKIRRNIIVDTWAHNSYTEHSGRIQGIFVSKVEGFLLEENFFDHNGWSEVILDARANMFNHNVYIQYDNKAGGVIRGNILSRGAAHGIQARSGGFVHRNLFVKNAVSLNVGGYEAPTDPNVYEFNNQAVGNVVIEGRLMDPGPGGNNNYPRTTAVWGIGGDFISGILTTDNIVANRFSDGTNVAFFQSQFLNMGTNIIYKWESGKDMTNALWPHPDDNLGDYNASIGGINSTEAYLQAQRNRPLGELPWELTAYAANSYIREGFNWSPQGGYYRYPGQPDKAATGVDIIRGTGSMITGETSTSSYTMIPRDASNPMVSWNSSNPAVAEVYDYGRIRAISAGTTTISVTADDGGFTDSYVLTVQGNPIPVTGVNITAIIIGLETPNTRQLTPVIEPANASNRNVTWSSSNTAVATVDENGLIQSVGPGSAIITVQTVDGNFVDTVPVTVTGDPISTKWAGYPMDSEGNVDTAGWLGWVNVSGPWVWMYSTSRFAYLPESQVTANGAWTFLPRY